MLKRIVIPGFVAAAAEYENEQIFRSVSDPMMLIYFLHPFVLGFILAWVWDKTKIVWSFEGRWTHFFQNESVLTY